MARLTPKQKAFCDYYIELGNATEAARKAGYSEKTARFIGQENLTKPNIKSYIADRMAQKEKERIASQDEVLQFLTQVMRGEVTEATPIIMKDEWEMVEKEPNIRDRVKAAEQLGKRYSLWTDNLNVDGNIAVQFVDDIGSDEDDAG